MICRYSWRSLWTCPWGLSLLLMEIFLVKCETSCFETVLLKYWFIKISKLSEVRVEEFRSIVKRQRLSTVGAEAYHWMLFWSAPIWSVMSLLQLHWSTKFNFFFGTRGKISNPYRTFKAEFKCVSSFSPSPTVCLWEPS